MSIVMQVRKLSEVAAEPMSGGIFTGEVTIKPSVVGLHRLSTPASGRLGRLNGILQRDRTAAQSPPSPATSTSIWIAVVAFSGGLLIVLWAFVRGRVRRRDATFDCEASFLGC